MPRLAQTQSAALVLATFVLLPLTSCAEEPPDPFDDARCEAFRNAPDTEDAFDWLKAPAAVPRRPGGMTTDQALALAHKFDARGATRLFVVGNRVAGQDDYGPYLFSLGLLVELPHEPARRYQVFELYADQVRNNGYTPRADTGQKYLFVGWPAIGSNKIEPIRR